MAKPKTPPGCRLVSGRYYRVQYVGIVSGKQKQKLHRLTRASEGMAALYRALADLDMQTVTGDSRMPQRLTQWLQQALPGLSALEQKDTIRMAGHIGEAFAEFDVSQVQAKHVLSFLQQWESHRRTAQRYRSVLRKFFRWVIIQGDRTDNPVDVVSVKTPAAHTRYMTDAEFVAVRSSLIGESGVMIQCYVDLLYLTGQRGADIRLLRWSQVDGDVIHFEPSKTLHSTGAKVDIPITQAIAEVLGRAKALMRVKSRLSPYVIHNLEGSPYAATGVRAAWDRARERAGIDGVTLRDIRAKHATDADRAGHSVEQISAGLAHADESMTRVYLKQKVTKRGQVNLNIPKGEL
jgi:integrase